MEENKTVERKTLAILSIVFGSIGLAFSWVPIINNLAAIFGLAGAVMGIIALVQNRKSKKTKSIIGLVLSVVGFSIVLATQTAYSNIINQATGISSHSTKGSNKTYKVGQEAKYNGVTYKVNNVTYNNGDEYEKPADGKQYVSVNITITNNSKDRVSYNALDFKLDDNGNQTSMLNGMGDNSSLNSGDLAPGATVTGTLVGEGNVQNKLKLIYDGNMFSKQEKVTFVLH